MLVVTRARAAALAAGFAAIVGVTALAPPLAAQDDPDLYRFSNLQFSLAGNWQVGQASPTLILRPTNELLVTRVRVVMEPATPFPGSLEAARDAAWERALAGRGATDEVTTTEERDVPGGGIEREVYAAVAPSGGVYVAVVKSGDFLTRITLTADNNLAYQLGVTFLSPLLFSLEIVSDVPPPTEISGVGGGGLGADPSAGFDWDGPDRIDLGIYDHGCLPYEVEFEALVREGEALIGSVPPNGADWASTLATVRIFLGDRGARAKYDAANVFASPKRLDLYSASAAASLQANDPFGAVSQMLAGVERAPDDPDLLFNFAGALGHVGLANESLAVVERLESLGRQPKLAAGVDAEAAIAYLEGYAEMLLGRTERAAPLFRRVIAAEPFLNEASHALALVQAHDGRREAGKQTYLAGMWRFRPKRLIFCGEARTDVRPPVDETFDTSMGVPGELVKFWHPKGADDLERFGEQMGELILERKANAERFMRRALALGQSRRSGDDATPMDAYSEKMTQLIGGLEEFEPVLLALEEQLDAAREAHSGPVDAAAGKLSRWLTQKAATGNVDCRQLRALVNGLVRDLSPSARDLELAYRRYARVWYKIATGLNSKIGDAEWHEMNDQLLRADLEALNVAMLGEVLIVYSPLPASNECPEAEPPEELLAGQASPVGSPCSQLFGGLTFKNSFEVPGRTQGPKIDYEVGCDKIKASIEYDVLGASAKGFGTALGGFASVEIGRRGDYSIFAGARGEASMPGAGGGIKSGIYLEGDESGEVTGFGGRVQLSGKAGVGPLSKGADDDMKFNLLPDPPAPPRGPGLKVFKARP